MAEDEPDYFCPVCGDKLKRIYDATPIHFKGGGFYKTGG
jgi:predicted nucleic acid-binding Zn ribbon protein